MSGMMKMGPRFMGRPVETKTPDQKLREVSDMYEKHFLREMMKAMRSTVHEGGFIQSNQAEKIFKEQLDDHYVEKWGEKGGIGLSNLIYDQLVDRYGAQLGLKKPVQKPQGPISLDEKSNYTGHAFRHPGKKDALSYRFDNKAQEAADVKAPWDGVLAEKKNLSDNQTLVEIEHDNGLKSQMVFNGSAAQVKPGQKLQAGETLGVLSPEAKTLYWTVEGQKEAGPESVSE
ncbi:rod-binding protein [Bdellovibrio sp. HCB2-146]|uniref:rod-binding protein n=1 Tax=Bdellovibrio sp. HCB2-146 TaxID=3394362 RepID=UPI0039BC35E7